MTTMIFTAKSAIGKDVTGNLLKTNLIQHFTIINTHIVNSFREVLRKTEKLQRSVEG